MYETIKGILHCTDHPSIVPLGIGATHLIFQDQSLVPDLGKDTNILRFTKSTVKLGHLFELVL